jgi:hypothetical protein
MTDDLLKRLRYIERDSICLSDQYVESACGEAADRIAALEAELARLKAPASDEERYDATIQPYDEPFRHVENGRARAEIIRLMREYFDPTPPELELPAGEWSDNAEDVADKIVAVASSEKPAHVSDAWRIVKRWLDGFAEEEAAFSKYRDDALIEGVMSAGAMRALNARLAIASRTTVDDADLVQAAACAIAHVYLNGGDPNQPAVRWNGVECEPQDFPAWKDYLDEARAVLAAVASKIEARVPDGWKLVPIEPTQEMLEAAFDESGWRVEPYTAPRESGVAIDSDMSEADAAEINEAGRQAHADTYRTMLAAAPTLSKGGA